VMENAAAARRLKRDLDGYATPATGSAQ
jgi:hypothetical protein